MSGWLRNLQGQLTELASEVLSEATEEVEDPGSELQVTKKKLEEIEQQLLAEKSNSELLQSKLADLNEQLYSKNIEIDTVIKKYTSMVESRDVEIRSLQVELERLQHRENMDEPYGDTDDEEFLSDTSVLVARLKLKNEELNKEIQHWKRIANCAGDQNDGQKMLELESKLKEIKQKSEEEMATLIQAHRENIERLKNFYEEKLNTLQVTNEERYSAATGLADREQSEKNLINADESTKSPEEFGKENEENENVLEKEDLQYKEKIQNLLTENEKVRSLCEQQTVELDAKNSEISGLQSDLEQAHQLIDMQREKFNKELSEEKEKTSQLLGKIENTELALKSSEERFNAKDHEMDKLRRENRELTAAYNDLNEEFENHRAEHGSVVTSNRDLTMRIDALKANLIEYEEKYELCKAENAETAKQLEKLTSDFENLRLSFESTKESSSFDSMSELERLRAELENVKHDRERLRADVDRFTQSVKSIDVELNKLRTANKKLEHDNAAMASNLDMFMDIRDTLEKRDQELKKLYAEIMQLQEENSQNDVTRQALAEVTQEKEKLVKELEECRAVVSEHENSIRRYRAILGSQAAEVFEMKDADGKSSSEGTSDSNNEWVKTGDWDTTTSTSAQHHLMEELKEALAMVTEKTDECDELRRQKGELEKELEMRQNCIDELMAQTNSLQAQQQIQAESFNEVRDWLRESDRKKLDAERALVRLKEEFQNTVSFYDIEIQRLKEFLLRHKELTTSATEASIDVWSSEIEAICCDFLNEKTRRQQYLDDTVLTLTTQEAIKLNEEVQKVTEDYQKTMVELKNMYEENVKRCIEEISMLKDRLADAERKKSDESEGKKSESDSNMKELENELQIIKEQYNKQVEISSQLDDRLKKKELELSDSERIRAELVLLVEQKHEESTNYHAQLQSMVAEKERIQSELRSVTLQLGFVEEQLSKTTEAKDKALKECERLREHLVSMEESFTRDAVAAEERETSLRSKIRELELKTEETADTVISSSNAYEKRLEELTNELCVLKSERDQIREELVEKTRTVEKTEKALSDLRKIVRDIDADHESQIASYESQISKLGADVQKLEKEMGELYTSEETLLAEKEKLIASEKSLKEELAKKDSVIDELETQLDEKVQSTSSGMGSTYRIDDETLRQLFLSYFTAEPSKKPEIAVLLSSILNYSPEDAAKIQAANATANRSWFGFSGPQRHPQTGPSITEQFIRFLERESLGPPSHPLPIHASDDKSTIRSSPLPTASNRYSDTGDLRSILDS